MSEQEPNDSIEPRYHYTYGEMQIDMTPENCDVYLFSQEPWYDHIYIKLPKEYGNRGLAFWRIDSDIFDDITENLYELGAEPYEDTHAPEEDKEYFKACGKELPNYPGSVVEDAVDIEPDVVNEPGDIELRWISPRAEELARRTAEYIVWLAEQGRLLDES